MSLPPYVISTLEKEMLPLKKWPVCHTPLWSFSGSHIYLSLSPCSLNTWLTYVFSLFHSLSVYIFPSCFSHWTISLFLCTQYLAYNRLLPGGMNACLIILFFILETKSWLKNYSVTLFYNIPLWFICKKQLYYKISFLLLPSTCLFFAISRVFLMKLLLFAAYLTGVSLYWFTKKCSWEYLSYYWLLSIKNLLLLGGVGGSFS